MLNKRPAVRILLKMVLFQMIFDYRELKEINIVRKSHKLIISNTNLFLSFLSLMSFFRIFQKLIMEE